MSDQAVPLQQSAQTGTADAIEANKNIDASGHLTVGVPTLKLAMWIFLASEVIFFSALIGTGILLRAQAPPGTWPAPGAVLDVPLTSLNTFILIVSSVTVVMALQSLQENKQFLFFVYVVATLILGSAFLGVQGYEYYHLIDHGLMFDQYTVVHEVVAPAGEEALPEGTTVQSIYGMAFYIQTGFHGAHVLVGVIWLLLILFRALGGVYSSTNYIGFEVFGLYWHFVDLVWIILFTIVYLI